MDGRGRVRWAFREWPGEEWAGWHLLVLAARHTPPQYLAYLQGEGIPYLVAGEGLERSFANTLVALSRIAGLGAIYLAGWTADRMGLRRIMGVTFLATGMATVLLGSLHGAWIIPLLFLQPVLISSSFPAGLAALSKIAPSQVTNVVVSLSMAISYIFGAGAIPAGIGFLGEHGFFSLGFILVGLLLMGSIILLKYLKFHQES